MIDPKRINEFVQKIIDDLPEGVKAMPAEFQTHLHAALLAGFSKMDLVTREEFDVQAAVLQKTRLKLEDLEQQISELESKYTD
jgi:ubiquinone biosynthesis accessory factor UbiK